MDELTFSTLAPASSVTQQTVTHRRRMSFRRLEGAPLNSELATLVLVDCSVAAAGSG